MANEKWLVDAKKLVENFRLKKIDDVFPNWQELSCTTKVALSMLTRKYREIILSAPIVDAVEVVHGRWIEKKLDDFRMWELRCSECGWVGISNYDAYDEPYDFNYCPNCGAKMDGRRE